MLNSRSNKIGHKCAFVYGRKVEIKAATLDPKLCQIGAFREAERIDRNGKFGATLQFEYQATTFSIQSGAYRTGFRGGCI